jgi:limonene-1,2-epoxide hydrolase
MKTRIRLEDTSFTYKFTNNHQKHGDIGNVATKGETVLYQRTDRAIVMFVKIIVMVLGNRE